MRWQCSGTVKFSEAVIYPYTQLLLLLLRTAVNAPYVCYKNESQARKNSHVTTIWMTVYKSEFWGYV